MSVSSAAIDVLSRFWVSVLHTNTKEGQLPSLEAFKGDVNQEENAQKCTYGSVMSAGKSMELMLKVTVK